MALSTNPAVLFLLLLMTLWDWVMLIRDLRYAFSFPLECRRCC